MFREDKKYILLSFKNKKMNKCSSDVRTYEALYTKKIYLTIVIVM